MQFPEIYKCVKDGYSITGDDGTQVSFADGGKMRKRILFDITQYEITCQVLTMTTQEALNLRQFYNTYKYELIDWTDPFTGLLYSVSMTAEPRIVKTSKTVAWNEVRLQGVVKDA